MSSRKDILEVFTLVAAFIEHYFLFIVFGFIGIVYLIGAVFDGIYGTHVVDSINKLLHGL